MVYKELGFGEFISLVLEALDQAGATYMIGGAIAAWAWGEPRATQDLDVVIHLPLENIQRLSQELEKRDMLVPADLFLDRLLDERADHPVNAIHMHSGYKADIFVFREGDEHRKEALQRRRLADMGPDLGEVYLHSPEDLILYKLWYYGISQQTKHIRDITAIVKTLGKELDLEYLEHWAEHKGVNTLWAEIYKQIIPPED